ncbi:MAG TPA: D-2-hydroxyacid dehydrogenase [Planctomycetota bacterium]|nr:D-2-hydroxyacid dehydrogenase [Planctomycetota bacterium]
MPETILVCFPVPRERIDAARAQYPQFNWRTGAHDDAAAIAAAEIIFGKPDVELLKGARRLKWQQNPSAGVEDWASCEAFQKGTFILTTAAGMHESCAQHAFALLLALARRINLYEKTLVPGAWKSARDEDRPLVLSGITMGVLGLGALGRRVCELARAFGMKTIGVNRGGTPAREADETHPIAKLDSVLPRCDVLMLILPATRETDDLIDARRLALLPRHCLLINVGRGNAIDERALIGALKSGHIAGAGLDVFKQEPLPANSEFYGLPTVLITPHIGGDRPDYESRAFDIFLDNLQRYVRGEKLKNCVERERGY